MSMQAYEFDQSAGSLTQQADGQYVADFELAAYRDQVFNYAPQGINSDNLFEIEVKVEDSETPPVSYHSGQTEAFNLGDADGVFLVAVREGKRKGSLTIHHV